MRNFIIGTLILGTAFSILLNFFDTKGIVTVPYWSHGVAFCGEEYDAVVHKRDAHTWVDKYATYVVNAGHENDPEVKHLEFWAEKECAQFLPPTKEGEYSPSGARGILSR